MTDIIMLTKDHSSITIECLEAIHKFTADYQIIWIDNGSDVGELNRVKAFIQAKGIPYRLIRNARNEGFIRGVNQGINASTSEHLVLMNNDVVVTERWLEKMLDFQQTHPRAGVIGVLTDTGTIQNYNGPKTRPLTKWTIESGDPFDYHNHLPPIYREVTASCVPFSCVLMSKRMIQKVGLLDEDFSPGYGDDDDYCDRARLAGWRTVILLNVLVYHKHGATFYSEFQLAEMERIRKAHRELYFRKRDERRQS